jgi:dinuclear metal center YbgI/SA1388 family protein
VVVAHHPIVFKGLKKFNGRTYVERAVIKAIKHDVALYAAHTNLDNVTGGVNFKISEKLSLRNPRILSPKSQVLTKLSVFVPVTHTQAVLNALYAAGAGQLGSYEHCSFRVEGTGTFKPLDGANPAIGQVGSDESVTEHRVEVIFPSYLEHALISSLIKAHPYELPAYDLYPLTNSNPDVGSGVVGDLAEAMSGPEFLQYLKNRMNATVIRHTQLLDRPIQRIAVCGGAGGFLLPNAIRAGADVLVTADYKYHEFFDADGQIVICDIGHFESEVCTKELIQHHLSKHFTNFAIILSETVTNPIQYYF